MCFTYVGINTKAIFLKKRKARSVSVAMEPSLGYGSDRVIALLGGAGMISVQSLASDLQKCEFVRSGLPKCSALYVQALLGITAKEMSALLDMSYRTYQRKADDEKLGLSSTEQLVEIAEVLEHALRVFNDRAKVLEWLNTSLVGLGGQKPIDILDTSFGVRAAHQALGRLEYGIFS